MSINYHTYCFNGVVEISSQFIIHGVHDINFGNLGGSQKEWNIFSLSAFFNIIDHIRNLGIGLQLACNGGSCEGINPKH